MTSFARELWSPRCIAAALAVAGLTVGLRAEDLTPQVNAAIDRGAAALAPELAATLRNPPQNYAMGYIALPLAALLKSGFPSDHELVRRALEALDELPPQQTYSVACYLFALHNHWQARRREFRAAQRSAAGTSVAADVPRLPPPGPVRDKMERLIDWLVRGRGGTWSYGGRGPGDLSNSQFAVLGLEIGVQNGIPVPDEVFRAIAEHFVRVQWRGGTRQEFRVTYRTSAWEGVTTGRLRSGIYTAEPGGWEYVSNPAGPASKNMTAAGVSSLLIARRALSDKRALPAGLARAVEGSIISGLGWLAANLGTFWGDYYGMYSLEKVGDIGGIASLGPTDWYAEGARWLLRNQRSNGSWGDAVQTSFALLFLTRATRPALETLAPPVQLTRGNAGGTATEDEESDLVYVPQVKGFVSARALFDFLGETRDPLVLPLAEEAARAFPPHRVHQALELMLMLWTEEADEVTRLARKKAAELAGFAGGTREEYARAATRLRRLREIERGGGADAAEVAALVRDGKGEAMRRRALDLIDRLGLVEAGEAVIEALLDRDRDVSARARSLLQSWSRELEAGAAAGEAGAGREGRGGKAAPDREAQAWRSWWAAHGEELRLARRLPRLLAELDAAGGEPEAQEARAAARQELVKLGRPAVPRLIAAMERGEYSLEVVQALEAISGEAHGVRAREWREWWNGTGGR